MKCLKCEYEWKPTVSIPKRCPRCKTSAWMTPPGEGYRNLDAGSEKGDIERPPAGIDSQALRDAYRTGQTIKPDMQELRDICAGKTFGNIHGNMEGVEPRIANKVPICGKQWWEDGNHYECLMDKGHKEQKHGLRGMVRMIE